MSEINDLEKLVELKNKGIISISEYNLKKQQILNTTRVSPKSRLAVMLLSGFLGNLGIHRFYLGKVGSGIAMLLTLGGFGIWGLVDFIMAICGSMKDKDGLYIKNWNN